MIDAIEQTLNSVKFSSLFLFQRSHVCDRIVIDHGRNGGYSRLLIHGLACKLGFPVNFIANLRKIHLMEFRSVADRKH